MRRCVGGSPRTPKSLTVATKNETVMVNDARVIKTDVTASNGVIHVIDSVVLPN